MAKKIRLTRPELKRHRDAMERFDRYLPMLKLKQQQLQITLGRLEVTIRQANSVYQQAFTKFSRYQDVLGDIAGVNVRQLAKPSEVKTSQTNVAGVTLPVFEDVNFPQARYSLFATPSWVDRAIADLRELNNRQAQLDILRRQHNLLQRELTKIIQRVNLFEKVKIPEAREAIRIITIRLGDEMTAAVCRAKIHDVGGAGPAHLSLRASPLGGA